ncbi:MAG: TonB-dependent receptor domain-containing protein [Candidatus Kapaibacterium sp.]
MRFFKIAAIAIIFISQALTAQQPNREQLRNMRVGVIKGKVINEDDGKPLSLANVFVNSMKDSALVSGAIADEQGNFTVDELPFGGFYVTVKFIGFEDKIIDSVGVLPRRRTVDLGTIEVLPRSVRTGEVTVEAEREKVEYRVDRKIVNIENDVLSAGQTAAEALERVPSINVDIEGNVTLRGSTNYTVFINGKPSVLGGTDALQQIPASSIKHIELITNPSAKYDPDGLAGIINIVLKERTLKGVSGFTGLSIGTNDKYSIDFKTTLGIGDFNVVLGGNYQSRYFRGNGAFERETFFGDTTNFLITNGNGRFLHSGYSVNGGVEYHPSDVLSMNIEGRYGTHEFQRLHNGNSHFYQSIDPEGYYSSSRSLISRNSDYYSLSYSLNYLIDDIGQKLDFLAYYSYNDNMGEDMQREMYNDSFGGDITDPLSGVRSGETGLEDSYRLQLDYVLPFNEFTKFEAGLQTRIDAEKEDFSLDMLDTTTGEWVFSDRFSNAMDFDRGIYAAYAQFASQLFSINYQLGLRAEYTDRTIGIAAENREYNIDRIDWFPTLHLSTKFGEGYQAMGGYSRRIHRPRGRFLDPFPSYRDRYTYHVGNPELEPEYTDSYEIGMQKNFEKSWISSEVYYRKTTNEFDRVSRLDTNGVIIHRIENLGSESSFGLEFSWNYRPWDWMNLNLVGNYYRYSIAGDIVSADAETSTNTWNFRFFSDFVIIDNLKLQVMSYYQAPTITSQGEREEFYMINTGLRYEMLDRNLSFSLSLDDVTGNRARIFTESGPGFRTYNSFRREGQTVMLNIQYKFNNYKEERRRRDMEQNGEDMDWY